MENLISLHIYSKWSGKFFRSILDILIYCPREIFIDIGKFVNIILHLLLLFSWNWGNCFESIKK